MKGQERVAGRAALLTLCALTLAACGARSEPFGSVPCDVEGETTPCQGFCGAGTSSCAAGYWGPCVIPTVTEACENQCGVGSRTCTDASWGQCQVEPRYLECTFGCGSGKQLCEDDTLGPCDAPHPLPPVLTATIRDFSDVHPDFELPPPHADDRGIVSEVLGPEDKPNYLHGETGTTTTTGQTAFDQWYRDVPGVNLSTQLSLPLTPSPTKPDFFEFGNRLAGQNQFFPIDDQLLGNEMRNHNFHFTLEASAQFVYRAGQIFRFRGDDDLWVFVNRRLVIDLGGLHSVRAGTAQIDQIAAETSMVEGQKYPLHIFFAERHTFQSNFYIETSISDVGQCAPTPE